MQTPLQYDIWIQSYEESVNAKNNIKQRNLNTIFAPLQFDIWIQSYEEFVNAKNNIKFEYHFWQYLKNNMSPTSDSFLLICHILCFDN